MKRRVPLAPAPGSQTGITSIIEELVSNANSQAQPRPAKLIRGTQQSVSEQTLHDSNACSSFRTSGLVIKHVDQEPACLGLYPSFASNWLCDLNFSICKMGIKIVPI